MTDDTMIPEDTRNGDGKALQIAVGRGFKAAETAGC
jgi:hypothetical protein